MSLHHLLVAIVILACVISLACSCVNVARIGKALNAASWWTPDQVRAIESCRPGDTILLSTDQHFSATQRAFIREWADEMKAKTGVRLIVLEGGLKPAAALRTTAGPSGDLVASTASFRDEIERQRAVSSGSAADRPPDHLIDEIDARLSARTAELLRAVRPGSDGSPPAHP